MPLRREELNGAGEMSAQGQSGVVLYLRPPDRAQACGFVSSPGRCGDRCHAGDRDMDPALTRGVCDPVFPMMCQDLGFFASGAIRSSYTLAAAG